MHYHANKKTFRSNDKQTNNKNIDLKGIAWPSYKCEKIAGQRIVTRIQEKKIKKKMSMVNPNVVVDDAVNLNSPKKKISIITKKIHSLHLGVKKKKFNNKYK